MWFSINQPVHVDTEYHSLVAKQNTLYYWKLVRMESYHCKRHDLLLLLVLCYAWVIIAQGRVSPTTLSTTKWFHFNVRYRKTINVLGHPNPTVAPNMFPAIFVFASGVDDGHMFMQHQASSHSKWRVSRANHPSSRGWWGWDHHHQ